MKKIALIFLLFSCFTILGQTNNDAVYEVYENLVNAIDSRDDEPEISINKNGNSLAYYSSKHPKTIHIDQKAIDICKSFGEDYKNALAFIISHELIHHYDHRQIKEDKKDFKDFSFMHNLKYFSKDSTNRLRMETEADLRGGFYSFLAGYNSLQIAPMLLDSLYTKYQLSSHNTGYPSLEERKNMTAVQIEKLERLKAIFNGASYALMTGFYKGAQEGFSKILEQNFTGTEIYNNLGLAYMLEAVEELNELKKLTFGYPFEYDAESRLTENTTRAIGGDSHELINKLLKLSIKKFEKALKINNDYAIAQLNLSCAYSLLAEIEKDENIKKEYLAIAQKELEKYGQPESNQSLILSGILYAQKNDSSRAKKYFKKAMKNKSTLAELNLIKLKKEEEPKNTNPQASKETIKSDINGSNVIFSEEIEQPDQKIRLDECKLYYKEIENTTAYFFASRKKKFFLQITKGEDHITSKGIKVNDPISLIKEKYGNPAIIRGNKADHYWYENSKIVFFVKDNKVTNWLVYDAND